jgi:hypothetical protein
LAKALRLKGWRTARRHLESLVLLVAAGGEHISDLAYLRADEGLRRLLGFELSSPTQAKGFLYAFHQAEDGRPLTADDDEELSVKGEARIRAEGPGLKALGEIVQELVRRVQATSQRRRATLDVDATIIKAFKETALKAYEGTIGYQPQMAWWAEQMVWVADELCDGNVPAAFKVKDFLVRAFAALPGSVVERRLRGDSALYDEEALSWAADEAGIEFVVSADMSQSLLGKIKALRFRLLNRGGRSEAQSSEVDGGPAGPAVNIPGVVIRHARQVLLRLAEGHPMLRFYAAAREAIADLLRPPEEAMLSDA